ncbi:MAG TPA: amidohydrolase family protein [Thermomicrobiales bacterium]
MGAHDSDTRPEPGIVDCDIHPRVSAIGTLRPYLTEHWQEYTRRSAFKGPPDTPYPDVFATSLRPDAKRVDGVLPASDPALMRARTLDAQAIEIGILNCDYAIESIHNPDAAAALAAAVNDWLIHEWLDVEPRFRASVVVASQQPEMAAREIERVGSHPGFVQVFLPVRSAAPYGNRRYHPIFAAAEKHGLVVGIHFGGSPGNPPTAAGWPTYYLEEYAGMSHVFQTQLLSLIAEGVFDQFPNLRVALAEGGFSWLPAFLWRLDKEWKGLRREIPWVRRLPSEYVRERVRLTTQPFDTPEDPAQARDLLDQFADDGLLDLLMFATDFPHWHPDTPEEAVLAALPEPVRARIMRETAQAFYRL